MIEKFLRITLFIFMVITSGCFHHNNSCITLDEAENIVLYQIVRADTMEWDSTKIRVYELPGKLKEGDTVRISKRIGYEEQSKDTTIVLKQDCWYFFIDDEPLMDWIHRCRHVFIYCNNKYEVILSTYALEYYWDKKMVEIKW